MTDERTQAQIEQDRSERRRVQNILIHSPMQREFSIIMIVLFMICIGIVGFVIHETIRAAALGGGLHFGKLDTASVLSEIRQDLLLRVSSVLFAAMLILGAYGVLFLHRIAGPVHRFRQTFRRLNHGRMPQPINLRQGDFFNETAYEINKLVELLEAREKKREQVRVVLQRLAMKTPGEDTSEMIKEIETLLEEETLKPEA